MGFGRLSTIFAFLALTLVASHAATTPLPPQVYWNSVLPNTPLPKSISELVPLADFDSRIGKGGDTDGMFDYNHDAATDKAAQVDYGIEAPVDNQTLTEGQTPRHFFLEEDIQEGTTMIYRLTGNSSKATFMSRKAAAAVPFSSSKLPEILSQFSVKPGSAEADEIKETIGLCEKPSMTGEDRQCSTSLESMIDFATSKLGRNVQAISTEVVKGAATVQDYRIAPGVMNLSGNEMISCHRMNYPYAVFYCHKFTNARAYMVPLEGSDGTKAKAVAVCHIDTSGWVPKHIAFKELKMKPGTAPICHFHINLNVIWLPNQKST